MVEDKQYYHGCDSKPDFEVYKEIIYASYIAQESEAMYDVFSHYEPSTKRKSISHWYKSIQYARIIAGKNGINTTFLWDII